MQKVAPNRTNMNNKICSSWVLASCGLPQGSMFCQHVAKHLAPWGGSNEANTQPKHAEHVSSVHMFF